MVDINELVDKTLAKVTENYFLGIPDLGENEPEIYLTYDISDTAQQFAEGTLTAAEYAITVNICTTKNDNNLKQQLKSEMAKAGFIYVNGGNIFDEEIYPIKYRHFQEYLISLSEN